MITKKFHYGDDGWGGLYHTPLAWVNFSCPYCEKYHSQSFLFDIYPDREEYEGKCERCGEKIRILMDKELNNHIIKEYYKRKEDLRASVGNPTQKSLSRFFG